MARAIRLLRVAGPAEGFASLLETAAAAGCRLGWLQVGEVPQTPLDPVASRGAARAVALDARGSVAVKRTAGPPVLRDVLREHFLGCTAVLVRAIGDVPPSIAEVLDGVAELRCEGDGYRLAYQGERRTLSREELIAAFGRPGFWAWRSSELA